MDKELLKISLYFCANNLSADDISRSSELNKNFDIKPLSLTCSGRINIQYFLKAIETGSDGVVLVICPEESCQFIEGNMRAKKRVMAINSLLKETGFEDEKIKIIQPSKNDSKEQIIKKIITTCNTINFQKERKITV